jgi:hypothetical protein
MRILSALLFLGLSGSVVAQHVMPQWALRVLNGGVTEARVEFRYELTDECMPTNLRLVEAQPDGKLEDGDVAELLRIAAGYIGPFDTAGKHWPIIKATGNIGRFVPAHYKSHLVSVNISDRPMTIECVFESGALQYAEARSRTEDGGAGAAERLEQTLSSLGASRLIMRFGLGD